MILSFRASLTELSVLQDVLSISKAGHYMVLDPVSQEPPENKAAMHLQAKRKVG